MVGISEKVPFFSVIISVFNATLYLKESVHSIVRQSYDNFELLLIENGSTDESLALCRRFASEDHRIQVYHLKHRNQGVARNLGLRKAKGKYIIFIDPKDTLDKNTLAANVQILNTHPHIDCLQYPLFVNYGSRSGYLQKFGHNLYDNYCFKKLLLHDEIISLVIHNKIFRKKALKNLCFREDIINEDHYFMLLFFQKMKVFYTSNAGIYYSFQREIKSEHPEMSEIQLMSTSEILNLILNFLDVKSENMLFYQYLLQLIQVERSLESQYNISTMEYLKYKNDVKISHLFKANLSVKDIIRVLNFKYA